MSDWQVATSHCIDIVWSPCNQAYFVLWGRKETPPSHRHLLAIKQTYDDALDYIRTLLPKENA